MIKETDKWWDIQYTPIQGIDWRRQKVLISFVHNLSSLNLFFFLLTCVSPPSQCPSTFKINQTIMRYMQLIHYLHLKIISKIKTITFQTGISINLYNETDYRGLLTKFKSNVFSLGTDLTGVMSLWQFSFKVVYDNPAISIMSRWRQFAMKNIILFKR